MTNTELLEQAISDSGLKKNYIAKAMGISPYSLTRKIGNKSDFKTKEVNILCDLLHITTWAEKSRIFFAE